MEEINLLKKEVCEIFKSKKINKILFIGGSDTGKTTLIKNIANFLFEEENIFIFDCDVGQSHVGPPTTIGYAKLKDKIDDFYLEADKFYFVGSITPSNSIIEFITGVSFINQFINKEKGKILIDTTGYVKNRLAISLKIKKIEILQPDYIILLEKETELEEIERFLKFSEIKYTKLKVKDIPLKSMEERALYRKNIFLKYFGNVKKIVLNLEEISIKMTNLRGIYKISDIKNINLIGSLCGLKKDLYNYICLGIISEMKNSLIKIFIPDRIDINFKSIKSISLSNFFLSDYLI